MLLTIDYWLLTTDYLRLPTLYWGVTISTCHWLHAACDPTATTTAKMATPATGATDAIPTASSAAAAAASRTTPAATPFASPPAIAK